MLAYVFWHAPREGTTADAYEQAQLGFHRSLAHSRPAGLRRSALFRIDEMPWAPAETPAGGVIRGVAGAGATDGLSDATGGYEDWYVLDDFTALGVLNKAAVGVGHHGAHERAAHGYGRGAGAVYALIEGAHDAGEGPASLGESRAAIWVGRPLGVRQSSLGELLGDGMDPRHASLWQRQLVLGPAAEFCLLLRDASVFEQPEGLARTRLPADWSATVVRREALWDG
jgi:hypothetical protein